MTTPASARPEEAMTKSRDIVYAPGLSIVIVWRPSQGIDKLRDALGVLQAEGVCRQYLNTTVLHYNESDQPTHLEELAVVAAEYDAAITFAPVGSMVSCLERVLRLAPSENVLCVDPDRPVSRDLALEAIRALKTTDGRIFVSGHLSFHQSHVEKKNIPPFCAVIPMSLPKLSTRVEVCSRSIQIQSCNDEAPDVVVAFSFSELSGDEALLLEVCHRQGTAILFHRHEHNVFPPALTRNVGARRVVDRLVAFVDADMYLHPETFREASTLLKKDPCVVYVEPAMMHYVDEKSPMFQGMTKEEFEERSSKAASAPGTGSVVFVTQEALQATHGYDERFIGYGYTDWDFTARLPAAGFKVVSLTKATGIRAIHIPHGARHGTNPPSKENEAIYIREKGLNPKRNLESWGGIPVEDTESI